MIRSETFSSWIDWSRKFLAVGFGLSLILVLLLAWKAPSILFFLPILLIGSTVAWQLFKYPTLNLIVLLFGFSIVSNTQEGLQATEAMYGIYYFLSMAYWVLTHWLNRGKIIETPFDSVFLFFLLWIIASVFQTLLFGGELKGYFSEMIALAFLFLYFPVKELCSKHEKGSQILIGILMFQGFFAAIRNLMNYREIIVNAQFAWQLEKGRVITNEQLLLIPALICLTLFLFEVRWKFKMGYLSGFLLFLGSLILTQSRAYWVDFAFGSFVLFFLLNWKQKAQLIGTSSLALTFFIVLGIVFFGNLFYTVLEGLVDRLLSLGSATTSDISLINRFMETNAVWEKIIQNPIIGYGTGVSYAVYDITFGFTQVDTFVHNGFYGIWYKFGLIGLGLLIYIWGKSIRSLFSAWLKIPLHKRATIENLSVLMVAIALTSLLPSATTSNPFFLKDAIMTFAVLFGAAAGLKQKMNGDE
ncbi:MAG TPA: hypothetical protein DIW24_06170 [Bacteroidetes bacterium]|nr:hypothetical protein [Bacteroidota bacterium]